LYLKFTGGSGSLFNFNWWKFTGIDPVATPTPGIHTNSWYYTNSIPDTYTDICLYTDGSGRF
jgi:hypothetical protein